MSPRVWIAAFSLRVKNMLQYRTAAIAGIATQFFWGFMFCMLYTAFYRSGAGNAEMTISQLIDYVWLRQAFLAIIMSYIRDAELAEMITRGNIAYELVRPVDLYGMWYTRLLAQRIAAAALRCLPILLVSFLLPAPYNLSLPPSFLSGALFLLTLCLAALLMTAISMFIYTSIFKTMSLSGSMFLAATFIEFFAGNILPVALMPVALQRVCAVLPFQYTADFPLRVYSGNILPQQAIWMIGIQLFWIVSLFTAGRYLFNRQLKNVVVQGG